MNEKLIFLVVVVVISILSSWWKKKQGEPEDESNPWPGYPPRHRPQAPPARNPAPPPPPSQASNWEEELRRLLQGEEPARPAPPPIVVQQSVPAPPPLPRAVAPRPGPAPRPVVVSQVDPDMEKGLPVQMQSLEQSAQTFLRASQLESRVAEHMHGVDQQVTTHQKVNLKKVAPQAIRQAIGLVRNRQSQRAAIIAGIILGPPKAMEA